MSQCQDWGPPHSTQIIKHAPSQSHIKVKQGIATFEVKVEVEASLYSYSEVSTPPFNIIPPIILLPAID